MGMKPHALQQQQQQPKKPQKQTQTKSLTFKKGVKMPFVQPIIIKQISSDAEHGAGSKCQTRIVRIIYRF
jgi:hypothetical protein